MVEATNEATESRREEVALSTLREREQINLPRADGGLAAWLFLSGSFVIEALV